MPISATDLNKAYLAYFGRPADFTGQSYFATKDLADVVAAFDTSAESKALYGDNVTAKVNAIYNNLFNRDAEPAGLQYWVNQIQTGKITGAGAALAILNGALTTDAASVQNKLQASAAFVAALDTTPEIVGYSGTSAAEAARVWLKSVGSTTGSLTTAIAGVDAAVKGAVAGSTSSGGTFNLVVGQDSIVGTSSADTFKANVSQNDLGQQVNTLGSGDVLNGGAGIDTLSAKITAGVFAGSLTGGSSSMPIQAETTSVEMIKLQAVQSGINDTNTEVYVNAKDMHGITKIASNYSDANLVIQNLTTLDNAGNARNVSDLTVGMEYTGNADSRWNESDMTVYFDQDYLTPRPTSTNPSIDILAMNEDAYDQTGGAQPLVGVFFRELTVTVNGTRFDLTQFMGEDRLGGGTEITTYPQLLAAIQNALVQLKAANPGNAPLQTLTASFGGPFLTDVDPVTLVQRVGETIRLNISGLTNGVSNTLKVASTDLEVARVANSTFENNNRYERADNDPAIPGKVLSINVDLEKVGLAGDGGKLVIGSMNKTSENVWDAVNTTTATTSGIEQFDVTVRGNNDKSSSLSGLHSTNNNLRTVNLVTDAALTGTSFADVTIGNSQTAGLSVVNKMPLDILPTLANQNALKDVQTFNASGVKGEVTLFAALTSEVTAKYMTLKDQAPAASGADNVTFTYTGGSNNDYLNIAIDSANLSKAGTTAREDFALKIAGGAGNDVITLGVVDATGLAAAGNWYENSKLNANLGIDAGAGDDTVWTPGSGDVVVLLGAGNDTAYSDNTGAKAVWAYNGTGAINNLLSDANNSYNLFKTSVSITFKGITATAAITDVNGVASDLAINQAIKLAINSNDVLKKLLVVTDGPANTLVVTSLIDGDMTGDLAIGLVAPAATAITAGEYLQLQATYGAASPAAVLAAINASVAAMVAKGDYDNAPTELGAIGTGVTDSTTTGDAGNDVIVLSTQGNSNEVVVYNATAFGADTIVNFEVAGAGIDRLNFTGLNGRITTQADLGVTAANGLINNSIIVSAVTADGGVVGTAEVGETFNAAAIKLTFDASALEDAIATNHVFITYNAANVGSVYTIVDGIGNNDSVVTFAGTIDLADTNWATLTTANFFGTVAPVVVTPTFSVSAPAAAAEGASATYTVTLAGAPAADTTVDYALSFGGTATAADLGAGTALTGTLTFAAGVTTQTVVVPFATDAVTPEAGEAVTLTLSASSAGSSIVTAAATTAITDVAPPAGSIIPVPAAGAAGTAAADTFTVNAVAALADAAGTNYQATLTGFSAANDRLQIHLPTANAAITTLDQLAGQQGVTVNVDPFDGSILINFGNDANGGEVVALTLTGVTDLTAVLVSIV